MRRKILHLAKRHSLLAEEIRSLELEIQKALTRVTPQRHAALKKIDASFKEELGDDVQLIIGEQIPKIYDHSKAKIKGEEIYISYNGVEDGGVIKVRPINKVSTALSRMPELYEEEYKYKFYFVENSIKLNKVKLNKIENILDSIIEEFVSDFLNFTWSSRKTEDQNV